MISIIFPTYNNYKFFCTTINSIIKQSYKDFECIIIDISEEKILKKKKKFIQQLNDYRFNILIKNINLINNFGKAINYGINNSNGKYITWIFDFISYSNNYLEILINNSFNKNHNFHYDLIYHENSTKISNIIFIFIIKKKIFFKNYLQINHTFNNEICIDNIKSYNYEFFFKLFFIIPNLKINKINIDSNNNLNYYLPPSSMLSVFNNLVILFEKLLILSKNKNINYIFINLEHDDKIYDYTLNLTKNDYFIFNINNINNSNYQKYDIINENNNCISVNFIFLSTLLDIIKNIKNLKINLIFNNPNFLNIILKINSKININNIFFIINTIHIAKFNFCLSNFLNLNISKKNIINHYPNFTIFINENLFIDNNYHNNITSEIYYFNINNIFNKIYYLSTINIFLKNNNCNFTQLLYLLFSIKLDNNKLNNFIDNIIKLNNSFDFNCMLNTNFFNNIQKKFLDYYDENCIKIFIKSYHNITTIYNFYDSLYLLLKNNKFNIDLAVNNIMNNMIIYIENNNLEINNLSINNLEINNLEINKLEINNLDITLSIIIFYEDNSEYYYNFIIKILDIIKNNKKIDNKKIDNKKIEIIFIILDSNYENEIIKNIKFITNTYKILNNKIYKNINHSIINSEGKYLIFFNKYFEFDDDLIYKLYNNIDNNENYGIIAPINNYYFESNTYNNNFIIFLKNSYKEDLIETLNINNFCFCVKKSNIIKIGLPKVPSVFNYELYDIIIRLNLLKLKSGYINNIFINVFNTEGTFGKIDINKNIKIFYTENNLFYYDNKLINYNEQNDIKLYIQEINNNLSDVKRYDFINNNLNAISIDYYFYKYVNNIIISDKLINFHIHDIGIIDGLIYSPKQIFNLYPKCKINIDNNKNIYVYFNNFNIKVNDFCNNFIYNKSFDWYMNLFTLITNKINYNNKSIELMIIVFIGNENIGKQLFTKLHKYKKIQEFSITFIFIDKNIIKKLYDLIKINFDNFSIYLTNQFGNDIIPTLIVYYQLIKQYKINFIIKLHSKSNPKWFNDNVDYLLKNNVKNLQKLLTLDCNCVGNLIYKSNDSKNNNIYIDKYKHYMNKKYFIAGTIFFCQSIVFDSVINFIKNNNYKSYFLNNLYDNNQVNVQNSPIHFIERLFGRIKI